MKQLIFAGLLLLAVGFFIRTAMKYVGVMMQGGKERYRQGDVSESDKLVPGAAVRNRAATDEYALSNRHSPRLDCRAEGAGRRPGLVR